MNNVKRSFLTSLVSLVLCLTMFLGTTFAWFTDIVVSGGNIIQSGKLDAEMYWSDEYLASTDSGWTQVKDNKPIFTYDNWEPGYTEIKYIKVANAGNLNFKWKLSIEAEGKVTDLSDVIDVYYVNPVNGELTKQALAARTPDGKLTDVLANKTATEGDQLTPGGSVVLAIAFQMDKLAGNEYQEKSLCDKGFSLKLLATQATGENDSFDDQYDKESEWPEIPSAGNNASADVPTDANGVVTTATTITGNGMSATVPAGTQLTQGTNKLTLSVNNVEDSKANVTLAEGEELRALDVHISGVAEGNTTPIAVTLIEALPKGLNIGNYTLHHVEDGQTVTMTLLADGATPVHNNFTYDPVTGDVTLYMASFSEVDLIAEPAKWEGNRDYSWYTNAVAPVDGEAVTEYVIANADQLAAFSAIVGGMDGQTRDSFAGKIVKLVADINLGDKESENNPDVIFYPIGYNSDDGKYEKTGVAINSSLKTFEGTFDGNGHTVSNFYHNTWEMKGDHDWYSPEEQYYRDGMGLFGRVYKGTVKNLTVKNFSSDGEIATTGVIAAYADGATFENIAIFNCNPRVYNIGNGGIVGCVGWYAKEKGLTTTFRNITVDNSNKISALWGSYDVACGGIVGQYYPTSGQSSYDYPVNAGMHFENCHVSAVMDVYNDVCANYQYYAYRYTGMLIGSVRENVTIDGHSYPKMDGITASDCTVHFGTWNDYYYCEIIDNTTASYTHDYQMSRLTEIKAIDGTTITYLDGTTGTVPASGRANYVIVDYSKGHGTENATCYHFKDGAVWNHKDAGYHDGTDGGKIIDENGDGNPDLREDKQHIYLEFNNLVTGYGWGVTSKGVGDLAGVTILDRAVGNSEVKFETVDDIKESYMNGKPISIGDLFKAAELKDEKLSIIDATVKVTVSPVGEDSTVTGEYVPNTTDWTKGTLTLSGTGTATITITDYYFCEATTITVNVIDRQPEEKFDVVMNNGDFLHRVGNVGTVPLDILFKAKDGVTVGTVSVTIEAVDGTAASGTYSNNAIQFNGTGVVKVTIKDDDSYCIPTVLHLEVVDAVNATGATSATSNNVVLLNDAGFSSLEVSGGYTLYGNGFTLTCGSDSAALDFGYSFVTLNNGTLDNVQIVTPNFDFAALYKSQLTSSDNRSQTTDRTRYYNAKSGVMVSGNSQILNSYISGGRAAVNVTGGNLIIDNSRLEGGAVATLLVGAANSLKLKDVTLIQKPTASTYDTSKALMGFSVLYMCDSEGKSAPTTLEGTLVQHAWVNAEDKKYVPAEAQDIVDGVMKETAFIHNINGKDSLNLGFAYMPEDTSGSVSSPDNIIDNRTDKATIPYEMKAVTVRLSILNTTVYVYSYKNTNGTADSFKNIAAYVPNKYGDIITVTYSDKTDGLESGKSFGTDGWVYELNVDLDKHPGYKLDFSKLSMAINGVAVTDFKVNSNAKPTSPIAVTAGGTTYILTATIEGKTYTATYKVTGTETSKESPSLVATNYEAGLCVAKSYGGTWHGAAPALQGIQIKYWSVAENQYKIINLSDYTPDTKGKLNGTNTTWTYSPDNSDFTLTLTGGQVHSSNNVYAMPVVCEGKLYFVAAAEKGLVNSGNSARTIPVTYTFKDNNNGEVLTFNHTWSVAENKNEQYKYSDFCNGTLTLLKDESCLVEGTLITMADGTQKLVEDLVVGDMVMIFNHVTGKYEAMPIIFNTHADENEAKERDVLYLQFSDGREVKVVQSHGFFDTTLMQYVYIDYDNYQDYIGHKFYAMTEDGIGERVELTNAFIKTETVRIFCPVTYGHMNSFANGFLNTPSIPNGITGLVNYFEYDDDLKYNEEKMQADIEKYGLYTYEDFKDYVSEEAFNSFPAIYFKVSVGKGTLTYDEILIVIDFLLSGSLIV